MGISATDISQRIVEAVLAQKLAPGARLGEQQLAMLFDCSRTIVREVLRTDEVRGVLRHYHGRRDSGTRRTLGWARGVEHP